MTTTTARKKAATSSVKSRCLLATTFSGAVAAPPAGTLSVTSRLTACPVTARTLLSRHVTRPAIGPVPVYAQAPDPALDRIGAAADLLELEGAPEAVRARRELVLARDRRRRARTQRAGRGRVALELGAQRHSAERPGEDALDGDGRHERALAAADALHVALQAPVAQPRLREHRPVGPAQPDELARLRDVHLQPGAARGGRRHVVAAGDRGLRLLVAPGREDHDDDDDRHGGQDRVVDDQPPCGRASRGDCIRGSGGEKVNFFARSRRRARRSGRSAAALAGRSSGSFSSARLTARAAAAGMSGRSSVRSGGGSCRWAKSTRMLGRPPNGGAPVRHSMNTQPERVDVGRRADVLAADLLGRHVVQRAERLARAA